MRKPIYDDLLRKGIEKLAGNEDQKAKDLVEAFNTVLNCEDEALLNQYYANMDEFYGVNTNDITYISAHYLLTNKAHLCMGEDCNA